MEMSDPKSSRFLFSRYFTLLILMTLWLIAIIDMTLKQKLKQGNYNVKVQYLFSFNHTGWVTYHLAYLD